MMKPSRFLTEVDRELTEPMELQETLPHLTAGRQPEELPGCSEENSRKD